MQHPFDALAGEYARLLANLKITKPQEVDTVARRLVGLKYRYAPVSARTGVPIAWLATTFEREASSNFRLYFGNGDPLTRTTVHVPKGRGPFLTAAGLPDWTAGTIDALGVDHISAVSDWSWPRGCFEWELWNGFGPRNHARHSGYLWAGTNAYDGGKYVSDGNWNPNAWDQQLGAVPVALRMVALDPSLAIGGPAPAKTTDDLMPAPQPAPPGVGGGIDVPWLQETLNRIQNAGLVVDGSYGRRTRGAVVEFQRAHGLDPDGFAGPLTRLALQSVAKQASPAKPPVTPQRAPPIVPNFPPAPLKPKRSNPLQTPAGKAGGAIAGGAGAALGAAHAGLSAWTVVACFLIVAAGIFVTMHFGDRK